MGSTMSLKGDVGPGEVGLGDLPESCVAEVMMHLDPAEICRLAKLCRVFRGAADADFIWERKLPENYRGLVEKVPDFDENGGVSKKGIYARLRRPVRFDGGDKEFWMEKSGICMAISSKGLTITGVDDRRYWNFIQTNESRFQTFAYLQQIWWLEVGGNVEFCFPAGKYSLYFRLHLGRPSRSLGRRILNNEHIHGWDIKPVKFQFWTSDGQYSVSEYQLSDPGRWTLYKAGDFVVARSDAPIRVKFLMTQIDCTHTKGGLCVDSVFIYPKEKLVSAVM